MNHIIPKVIHLYGRLDCDALERSIGAVVQRHESLRTCFPMIKNGPTVQLATIDFELTYLRQKLANRDNKEQIICPEVYLDESYINKNHSNDNTWYFEEDGIIIGKPTGKGDRLIIINAITKDGWVPNSKLVFKASKKTGDYHDNMNWDNFSK